MVADSRVHARHDRQQPGMTLEPQLSSHILDCTQEAERRHTDLTCHLFCKDLLYPVFKCFASVHACAPPCVCLLRFPGTGIRDGLKWVPGIKPTSSARANQLPVHPPWHPCSGLLKPQRHISSEDPHFQLVTEYSNR